MNLNKSVYACFVIKICKIIYMRESVMILLEVEEDTALSLDQKQKNF